MSVSKHPSNQPLSSQLKALQAQAARLSGTQLAAQAHADQRQRWQRGERVLAELYLAQLPSLKDNSEALLDFIYGEVLLREELGESARLDEYLLRFPHLETALRRQFAVHQAVGAEQLGASQQDTKPPLDQQETRDTAPSVVAPPTGRPDSLPERFGRYRVLKLLGKGGMGSVYLAHDTELDRPVALKVPRFTPETGAQLKERFYREARAAATLAHPNICPVYDVGTVDGVLYLTMAYVEGRPLTEHIKRRRTWPQREAADLVRRIALALEEAHRRGIVHRDLKPSNIMLNERAEPIVMDFGLARQEKPGEERLTQTGQVLGTPAYMPPEQVRGEVHAMGPRCDIYSLGVILYELLTGRTPFQGTLSHILARILTEEPPAPSTHRRDLEPALEAICRKALAKKSEERFVSMAEFAAALDQYLKEGATTVLPGSTSILPEVRPVAVTAPEPVASANWPWVLAAVVLMALFAGGFAVIANLGKDAGPAPNADQTRLAATGATAGVPALPPVAAKQPPVAALAKQARAILEANCYRCHGKDGAKEGGFNYALDVKKLVEGKKIVAGKSAASALYKKITSGEMPPEDEKPRPTPSEIATLARWLDAGAPAFEETVKQHPFRGTGDVLTALRDHLRKAPRADRPYLRYFTLTHQHNNKSVKEEELRLYRAALSKLINSLSWKNSIVLPEAIDADQTVFAIDLRKLDWDRRNLWHEVLKLYPYGLKHDSAPDEPVLNELAREVYELAGTDIPAIRADWFVATASRPPLYHTLLNLPATAYELEKSLKVNVQDNFLKDKLVRAGFTASGISGQNRLVERHESPYGAYWKSYDFRTNEGFANLFRYPLGPVFAGNPFDSLAFKHDGGEIIFNLPNGLQGYLLVDGKDQRIDEGPIEVVSDSLRTSGTAKVLNGLSCLACHSHGMKSEFKDTVRDGTALQGEARDKLRRVHVPPDVMKKYLDEDSARFLAAVEKATGPFLKVGADQNKDSKDFPEPIGALARLYILKELGLEEAALELGLADASQLRLVIQANERLRALGLGPLATGATIKRETWEALDRFISPYQEAASTLGIGTPIRIK